MNESQECCETAECVLGTRPFTCENWYMEGGDQWSLPAPEAEAAAGEIREAVVFGSRSMDSAGTQSDLKPSSFMFAV